MSGEILICIAFCYFQISEKSVDATSGRQGYMIGNMLEKYISAYDSSTVARRCGSELITSADGCKPFPIQCISCYLITDGTWTTIQNFAETSIPSWGKLSALINDSL